MISSHVMYLFYCITLLLKMTALLEYFNKPILTVDAKGAMP